MKEDEFVSLGASMGSFEDWLIAEQRKEKRKKETANARRRKLRLSRTKENPGNE